MKSSITPKGLINIVKTLNIASQMTEKRRYNVKP